MGVGLPIGVVVAASSVWVLVVRPSTQHARHSDHGSRAPRRRSAAARRHHSLATWPGAVFINARRGRPARRRRPATAICAWGLARSALGSCSSSGLGALAGRLKTLFPTAGRGSGLAGTSTLAARRHRAEGPHVQRGLVVHRSLLFMRSQRAHGTTSPARSSRGVRAARARDPSTHAALQFLVIQNALRTMTQASSMCAWRRRALNNMAADAR